MSDAINSEPVDQAYVIGDFPGRAKLPADYRLGYADGLRDSNSRTSVRLHRVEQDVKDARLYAGYAIFLVFLVAIALGSRQPRDARP